MTDGFQIRPDVVASVAGNIGGILMQTVTLTRDLDRLTLPPASFGGIGSAVATAGGALQQEQTTALRSLLKVVGDVCSQLQRVATTTTETDHDIAAGLWSSPTAGTLARYAMTPHPTAGSGAVAGVLDQMNRAGMGQLASHPVSPTTFGTPAALADWLDADPDNQARLGVIGVYSGSGGTLGDVPGGVHPGDVVFAARWQLGGPDFTAAQQTALAVVGSDGHLYDNGVISASDGAPLTDLRVYRPLSEV